MNDIKQTFAANLSSLRQAAGMTQVELGDRLNYSDKTVSKWERGESIPDAGMLKQIAEVFGVGVDYLLEADHEHKDNYAAPTEEVSEADYAKHMSIWKIVQAGVWLFAFILVVLCWIVTRKIYWLILIWTLPVSLLLSIIFASLWAKKKWQNQFIYISAFIFSVLLAIYLSALSSNLWMLFLIMIPVEILLYFIFKLVRSRQQK